MENDDVKTAQYECPCCGGGEWRSATHLPSLLFDKSTDIIVCSACSCGATWPPPNLDDRYYQENQGYSDLFSQNEVLYSGFAKDLLKTLDGIIEVEGKALLDVGCGGGFLVQAATDANMIAEGLETNEDLVAWATQKGLSVSAGSVRQLREAGKRYDVIVLSAILEHLDDPRELLQSCRGILKIGGVVLVSQASFDGLLPQIFPWGWYGWQPKEHYWHFTPNSFARIAERSGYRTVKLERCSLHHQWFTKGGTKVIVGRNLATLIARLGDLINRGDSFTAVLMES
jgi:SAM-dependent methyltransferase